MGTITGTAILNNAITLLQDPSRVRWPDPEPLNWLNDGQRYIALQRPDANAVTGNIACVLGTKQSLPATGMRLLDITRNMGATGTTPGSPVRLIDREILDAQVPTWHSQTAGTAASHYIYDNRNPKVFYVFPPLQAGINVEAIYSVAPADLAALANSITIDDIYAPVLTDYLLYRCWSKDAEYTGDTQRAAFYLNAVNAALGVKTKVDVTISPRANSAGTNPNVVDGKQ